MFASADTFAHGRGNIAQMPLPRNLTERGAHRSLARTALEALRALLLGL